MSDNIAKQTRLQKQMIRETAAKAYAIKSKDVKAQNTLRTDFYRRYLWRVFLGSVKLTVPDWWSADYVRMALFAGGGLAVTRWKGVTIPMAYTVVSLNPWHYPIKVVSCDTVEAGERTVGADCELVYLTSPNFGTPWAGAVTDLIDIYAQKLANADGAIDTNLLVSRTPWLAEVDNRAEADEAKALFTKIMGGEAAVFFRSRRNKNPALEGKQVSPFTRLPVKENFVADMIQTEKRQIINEFLTSIGVSNANTDKRERLISDEVNANNREIEVATALWQSNVDLCLKKVKRMFDDVDGFNIEFGERRDADADSGGLDADIPAETKRG